MIDGFYVRCIEASAVKYLVVEMIDGNRNNESPKIVHLQSEKITTSVHFPIPWDGHIQKSTKRIWRRVKFEQFLINIANTRTVHKLQGRSITNLVISTWNYTGNWVHVVLSRWSTLDGIFLCKYLIKSRPMSDKCQLFHSTFRAKKRPRIEQENIYVYNY